MVDKGPEHVTLVVTCFANGTMAKTGVILPLKTLPFDLESLENTYSWSGTTNGWITQEVFDGWTRNVLVPQIMMNQLRIGQPDTSALFLIDPHSS